MTEPEEPSAFEGLPPCPKLAQWLRAGCGLVLMILLFLVLQATDLFGLNAGTTVSSRFVHDRIAGLFYTADSQASERVTVILIDHAALPSFRDATARPAITTLGASAGERAVVGEWPPDYDIQAQIIEGTLRRCPEAVFIDIFYIFRRGVTPTREMTEDEAKAWRRNTGAAVNAPTPTIVEDDDFSAFLDRIRMAHAEQDLPRDEGGCGGDRTELFLADFDRQGQARSGTMNGMRVQPDLGLPDAPFRLTPSTWPQFVNNPASPYHGVDLTGDYPLTPVSEDETRPSAALAMYQTYCMERDPAGCPADLLGTPLWTADGATDPKWGERYAAPIDIRWRSTYPPQNDSWWHVQDCLEAFKNDSFWARVRWAARQVRGALFGAEVGATDDLTQNCFPLETVPAHHLAETFAVSDDARERARQDALSTAVSGKYVFIGLHLPNLGDLVDTPTHGLLPGVFRHAMSLDNLMRMGASYERPAHRTMISLFGAAFTISSAEIVEAAAMVILALALAVWGRRTADGARDRVARLASPLGGCAARSLAHAAAYVVQLTLYALLAAFAMAGLLGLSFALDWPGLNWIEVLVFMPLAYTFQSILHS